MLSYFSSINRKWFKKHLKVPILSPAPVLLRTFVQNFPTPPWMPQKYKRHFLMSSETLFGVLSSGIVVLRENTLFSYFNAPFLRVQFLWISIFSISGSKTIVIENLPKISILGDKFNKYEISTKKWAPSV